MAMATTLKSSGCNKNLSKGLSIDNNYLHDGSFSAYLRCSEEAFVIRKLAESKKETNELLYLGRKKVDDGEIGVFGAEKYFNGAIDEESPRIAANYQHVKEELGEIGQVKHKIQSGTPSVHSDSSWNSQSALLQTVVRTPPQIKTNKRQGKSLLAGIGCNCYCNGKNSVEIDDHGGESNPKAKTVTKEPVQNGAEAVDFARTNKSRLKPLVAEGMQYCSKIDEVRLDQVKREDCFSFPILNSKPENIPVKANLQQEKDGIQRNSLEVFGDKKKKPLSLERKLNMLTWDKSTGRIIEEGSDETYNDTESDASSDLFEIESFTNTSNSFLHRQTSDGMSSCVTPTTCYAPSEASIEWSVVTASAADFSMVSDSEDALSSAAEKRVQKMAPHAKFGASKETEKRRTGILSGCKSHKAVRVVGDAYRTSGRAVPESPRGHRTDSSPPEPRFQAKARLTGYDSTNAQRGVDACMIAL